MQRYGLAWVLGCFPFLAWGNFDPESYPYRVLPISQQLSYLKRTFSEAPVPPPDEVRGIQKTMGDLTGGVPAWCLDEAEGEAPEGYAAVLFLLLHASDGTWQFGVQPLEIAEPALWGLSPQHEKLKEEAFTRALHTRTLAVTKQKWAKKKLAADREAGAFPLHPWLSFRVPEENRKRVSLQSNESLGLGDVWVEVVRGRRGNLYFAQLWGPMRQGHPRAATFCDVAWPAQTDPLTTATLIANGKRSVVGFQREVSLNLISDRRWELTAELSYDFKEERYRFGRSLNKVTLQALTPQRYRIKGFWMGTPVTLESTAEGLSSGAGPFDIRLPAPPGEGKVGGETMILGGEWRTRSPEKTALSVDGIWPGGSPFKTLPRAVEIPGGGSGSEDYPAVAMVLLGLQLLESAATISTNQDPIIGLGDRVHGLHDDGVVVEVKGDELGVLLDFSGHDNARTLVYGHRRDFTKYLYRLGKVSLHQSVTIRRYGLNYEATVRRILSDQRAQIVYRSGTSETVSLSELRPKK